MLYGHLDIVQNMIDAAADVMIKDGYFTLLNYSM